jgi:nitrate reductase NapAB chaperone NapD
MLVMSAQPLRNNPPAHIASLVIHVRPQYLPALQQWLSNPAVMGVEIEIHAAGEQGKVVVVVEAENEQCILTLMDSLREQQGVLNTSLVYHEIIHEEFKD